MSTKLGTLTLDLIAKIGNFTGPIKNAEKQSKLSFDNMRKHVNTYGTAIIGIAASGATALAGMALQTANQAAELEQFALRANTTTQEFQTMAVGAAAFGIQGDKLSDMMKDFNEKLGELTAVGAGGGVDFFEQIAMKTEGTSEAAKKLILDMQKLSGPEALQLYVNKLEEAGVTQQQMSFYLESMASDMTDLIPLLANGGEGMRLYGDMAERAGIIMTDETIEAAKTLKDQVYMLDLQMQGAKNQLMQAVIPAFVDIAEAFFGGSEQGLQFAGVADGIAESLRFVAKMAIGAVTAIQLAGKAMGAMGAVYGSIQSNKDWYELGPLGYAKAMFDARGEIASIGKSYVSDANEMLLAAGEKMDAIDKRAGSSKANQLRGIREIQQNIKQTSGGLSELADKQNEAAKATRQNTSALRDQNRALEEQKRNREQISKAYASDYQNLIWDEKEQLDLVRGAGFSNAEQAKYLALVEKRFAAENAAYFKNLNLEINQYKWSEEKKLEYAYQMDREILENDVKLADEIREVKLQALDEQYATERNMLQISQSKELLETKRTWMTAGDYAREYYALVREEILNTASYSPEMKNALIKQANIQQGVEENAERERVWGDYQSMMGLDKSPYQQDMDLLAEAREQMLITEEEYQQQRLEMQTKYSASYLESMLGGFAALVDENSSLYAGLFAAQKAFAVAQAMLNIPSAYSKAYDAVVGTPYIGPYIAPAVGAAAAALQVAQAASIKSVGLTGMAHDGIDNIPEEGTWLLNKGERVLNPNQNKDLTNYLSQVQTGGQNRPIDNKLSVIMVKDEDEAKNYKYSKDFENAVLYHMKRNRSALA